MLADAFARGCPVSYDLGVAVARPLDPRALVDAIALADLRVSPELDRPGGSWPQGGLRLWRDGVSTRATEVDVEAEPGKLRVLATMRRVQWDVPGGFRDAGVFLAGGEGQRKTQFAVWLPDDNLVIPFVDYVALRVTAGEIVMVPFAAVAGLAGARARLLDECQFLIPAIAPDTWAAIVAAARPLAVTPRARTTTS